MKPLIYLDNGATTNISDRVFNAMLPFLKEQYGNPSSIFYSLGRDARRALDRSREQVAAALNAEPEEIYFTGGGTESDNWAIKSAAVAGKTAGRTHIITTNFEHHAILHPCRRLEKEGFRVTYLPVNEEGFVTRQQVAAAITEETALVSVIYANNEIGTIQPIAGVGKLCREAGVLLHTDAVQAVGNLPIDVKAQNIDLLSLSGHKIHAPKGVGALYIRRGVSLPNLLDGGSQERNKRSGTENLASIVGLGAAMEDAVRDMRTRADKIRALRDKLIDGILEGIPNCRLNGSRENRLPGNLNISFEAIEGEALLLRLDMLGICASSGSACTSGALDPSHVLLAIGLPHEIAHGSLRLTLNEQTTSDDADYVLRELPGVVQRLREMSPIWNGSHSI